MEKLDRHAAICCALFVSVQAFGAPYDDGVAAYDRGDYATALSLWLPLAEQGNAAAQCVIALQGRITSDTSYKFEDAVARSANVGCSKSWLLLESPGGEVEDGIRVAREVRFQSMRTITRGACASACSLIFVAGFERVLIGSRARIGLHQPATLRDYDKSRRCASGSDSNGVAEIRTH
jgi:hypothetical protein